MIFKNSVLLFSFTLILIFSGCLITSLNPIYHQEDLIIDTQIIGEWIGGKTIWTFKKGSKNSYTLSYKECNDPINNPSDYSSCTIAKFNAHLIKLNGEYFMNFNPTEYLNTENSFVRVHVRSMNSFAKIDVDEEVLRISLFSVEWFEVFIEKNPDAIDHVKNEEGIILTASTDKLQEFIIKYSNHEEAFQNPVDLKRYIIKEN